MEIGLILAICTAVCLSANAVLIRKATAQAEEAFSAATISVFIGVPFFAVAVSLAGDWTKLSLISWQALTLLAAVGIIHFVAGRPLGYNSYRLIGANKATTYIMTTPFYTVILGVLFLNEHLTVYLILGVLCIFAGAALITREKKSVSDEKQGGVLKTEFKGALSALGGAICWGITPIMIKPALGEIGSPLGGAFISYVAAAIVMALFLCRRQPREHFLQRTSLSILIPLGIGGMLAAFAQLLFYTALNYSPASLVTPLITTQIFFIFLFSFFLNRRIEVFTLKVILGMVATAAGTFLLFQ